MKKQKCGYFLPAKLTDRMVICEAKSTFIAETHYWFDPIFVSSPGFLGIFIVFGVRAILLPTEPKRTPNE